MEAIKVLLVDDHEVVRQGLRHMLEADDEIEIVAEAASCNEALAQAELVSPDVVLMDVKMPGVNGVEITRRLKQRQPACNVIMLTLYEEYLAQAVEAGAAGYLVKDIKREELSSAIKKVCRGETVLSESFRSRPQAAQNLLRQFQDLLRPARGAPGSAGRLTHREVEILSYVARGFANKQIGYTLGITEQTIKNHMTSILQKLNAQDRTQAVVMGLQQGLISV